MKISDRVPPPLAKQPPILLTPPFLEKSKPHLRISL